MLAKFAVEKPYVMLTIIFVVIAGTFWAISILPVRLQPYVETPMVGIITRYPGVSAEDMEAYISRPIEQRMGVLDKVIGIRSTSQEGSSEVVVEFEYGTDMKKAVFDVQSLMSAIQNDLPLDRDNSTIPWVVKEDPTNMPILELKLSRPGWDPVKLRAMADNEIKDTFQAIDDVQSVITYGGLRRQVQVIVDRDKLAAVNLGLMDIKKAIDENNYSRSGGRLTYDKYEIVVRTDARFQQAEPIADIPIGQFEGRIIYLKDVARVVDGYAESRSSYHFQGKEGILVAFVKEPEAAEPKVIKAVLKKAKELEETYPGLKFEVAYNQADYISIIVKNAVGQVFFAMALAGLVTWLFIERLSATAIILTTLPLAAGFGLILFKPFGLTINTATMMGYTFVMGRLVDDSIVLIDVIYRHLRMGKSPKQAAVDGTREVQLPIIATSVVFWIALLPMNFLGGVLGAGFRGMTAPMILANIGSTFLALTLNPLMAAHLFRPHQERLNLLDLAGEKLLWPFHKLIDGTEFLYRKFLELSLNYRLIFMALTLIAIYLAIPWPWFSLSGGFYRQLGQEMMPLQDTGQAVGVLEAWPGASFEETERIASEVEKIILKQPETRLVSTQIGQEPSEATYFSGFGMRTVNKATFRITFLHKHERAEKAKKDKNFKYRTIWQILDQIQDEAMRTIPGIRVVWFKEMGATVVASARANVEVVIKGDDIQTLDDLGQRVAKIGQFTPGARQVHSEWSATLPQYHIEIDRRRAQELGVSIKEVAMQAFYAMNGGMSSEFFKPEGGVRHHRILIRYEQGQRLTKEDLGQTLISSRAGRVPLKEVARVVERKGPDVLRREDMKYAISILGLYGDLGLKKATMGIVMGAKMQLSFPKGYWVAPKGEMLLMMKSRERLYAGLGFSALVMFVSLVLQFQSISNALVMLMAVPLSWIGSVLAWYIFNYKFSPPTLWGQVVLVGIVLSNSILLIDKITNLKKQGVPQRQAVIEGGVTRLRPIMMTGFTTIAGLIPSAFFPPTGMDRFMPIATGMIGGLLASMFLTLTAVPTIYTLKEDFLAFMRRVYKRAPEEVEAAAQATQPAQPAAGGESGSGGGGD